MNHSKSSLLLVACLLTVMSIATMGCSKQDGAVPVTTGRDARANGGAGGGAVTSSGITLNGWVVSSDQTGFQDSTAGFIGATVPETSLGYVSSSGSGVTGVFFGGRVELQSGVVNATSGANGTIRSDSKLVVGVYDEFVGRPDPQGGGTIPAFNIGFARAEGTFSGTHAVIKFVDATYGDVTMDGYIVGANFEGKFSYVNYVRWSNRCETEAMPACLDKPGVYGTIGKFQVPVCQFFRCQ